MVYKIIIEETAEIDANDYAQLIAMNSGINIAQKWLKGIEEKVFSLSLMPQRNKVIDESMEFGIELRQIIHKSHRIIYHINENANSVYILRIYHSARILEL